VRSHASKVLVVGKVVQRRERVVRKGARARAEDELETVGRRNPLFEAFVWEWWATKRLGRPRIRWPERRGADRAAAAGCAGMPSLT
jgi:hypothetical protein